MQPSVVAKPMLKMLSIYDLDSVWNEKENTYFSHFKSELMHYK